MKAATRVEGRLRRGAGFGSRGEARRGAAAPVRGASQARPFSPVPLRSGGRLVALPAERPACLSVPTGSEHGRPDRQPLGLSARSWVPAPLRALPTGRRAPSSGGGERQPPPDSAGRPQRAAPGRESAGRLRHLPRQPRGRLEGNARNGGEMREEPELGLQPLPNPDRLLRLS